VAIDRNKAKLLLILEANIYRKGLVMYIIDLADATYRLIEYVMVREDSEATEWYIFKYNIEVMVEELERKGKSRVP